MPDKELTPDARPDQFNYAELSALFSPEEQNAAAWLSIVLLLAESRAATHALQKLIVDKGFATKEEVNAALGVELQQPNLGNWYGFMHQLYAFRVAETLDIQKRKLAGEIENAPDGELTDVSGGAPMPTGAPPVKDIVGATAIIQTEPQTEGTTDDEEK